MPPSDPPARRPLPALALVAAVAVAYANGFAGPFVFDDKSNIVRSEAAHSLAAAWAGVGSDLRPVVTLTLAANHALGGLDVWGYHAVNVAAHAAAALVLFGLVRRTLRLPACRDPFGPAADRLGFAVALLWAVHPLQTESVTYVIQRAQCLMGLCFLLTLYALVRGATAERRSWAWYAAAVAVCAVGMGCKQDMVVAPVAAVLFDRAFLAGSWREVVRRRGAVHAGLFVTWVVLAPSVTAAFAVAPPPTGESAAATTAVASPGPSAGFGLERVPPVRYALTQFGVILHYLRLAAWPHPLCLDYLDWPVARGVGDAAPAMAAVGVLLAAIGYAAWRTPPLGFACGWFFFTLAPTSTVLPINDVVAEHRTYLPLAAVVLLGVLGTDAGLRELTRRNALSAAAADRLGRLLLVGTAATLGLLTFDRNADYRTEIDLWGATAAARPENGRVRHNLGTVLALEGRHAEAVEHFAAAARIRPDAITSADLAQSLIVLGRTREAVAAFREAVRLLPTTPASTDMPPSVIYYNLALALEQSADRAEAERHYRDALRADPDYTKALVNLANLLSRRGRHGEALPHLDRALRLDPGLIPGHVGAGITLARLGRYEEAVSHYRRAVELDPGNARALNGWATALLAQGKPGEAAGVYAAVVRSAPADPRVRYSLAHALHRAGDRDRAAAAFRDARRADPDGPRRAADEAWRLATDPDPHRRDDPEAVRLGEQAVGAVRTTGLRDDGELVLCLDALAAAYASAGRFPDAAATGRAAVEAAQRTPRMPEGQRAELQARVRGYERGEPFRLPAGGH